MHTFEQQTEFAAQYPPLLVHLFSSFPAMLATIQEIVHKPLAGTYRIVRSCFRYRSGHGDAKEEKNGGESNLHGVDFGGW